jgi:hypothetical protein
MTATRRSDEDTLLLVARCGPREFTAVYRHFERPMLGFLRRATGRPDLVGWELRRGTSRTVALWKSHRDYTLAISGLSCANQ